MQTLNANDYINRGFEAMRPVLAEYICRELEKKDKENWWERYILSPAPEFYQNSLPSKGTVLELKDTLDIFRCLKAIDNNWHEVFKYTMTAMQRTWGKELQETRNKTAHTAGTAMTDDEASRALDTMSRFMDPIDTSTAEAIRKFMQEIRHKIEKVEKKTIIVKMHASPPSPALSYAVPWRQIAQPHPDIAKGCFRQAEFAADLAQVLQGRAVEEYQDAVAFYERTYITEGMKGMLIRTIQRVSGKGGEPVVQLKTAFGGGKTHSMLALYHLMHSANPENLRGVREILSEAGIAAMPKVKVAVLVGTALDPVKPRRPTKFPGITINTLWGEMTAQLAEQSGNPALYEIVKQADKKGISPGSTTLKTIMEKCAPCLILIDELVAYARKLYGFKAGDIPAGTFENVLSFVQELTEAVRASKNCVLVASIPESETETGGEAGGMALQRIEHTFGRMEAVWKPVVAEEGFEIVRRRLFMPIEDQSAVDKTCRAYFSLYKENPVLFPVETKEADYLEKMKRCYPIHPEIFDRLYSDWAAIDDFQRTRGVLRLMAAVIYDLYSSNDGSAMITCGSIAVGSAAIRDELTRYLSNGWTPVIESEIDGRSAKPLKRDNEQGGYYKKQFAHSRIARTIFLGSAPSSGAQRNRGLDAAHVHLGIVQPEENIPAYEAAMTALAENLTYLYRVDNRYWFDTRPTLKKTVADRAQLLSEDIVDEAIERALKDKTYRDPSVSIHPAPSSCADVPDDQRFHLVLFRTVDTQKANDSSSPAMAAAKEYFEKRGTSPRIYRNMIAFLAPDNVHVAQLRQEMKMLLAWRSIEQDIDSLFLDKAQERETVDAITTLDKSIPDRIRETWSQLIVPTQEGTEPVKLAALKVMGLGSPVINAMQKMKQDELVIEVLSPKILSMEMEKYHLWQGKDHSTVRDLWSNYTRYVYLHRLKDRGVLEQALRSGIRSGEFFAYAEGQDSGGRYEGISIYGDSFQISADGLVVKACAAKAQLEKESAKLEKSVPAGAAYDTQFESPKEGEKAVIPKSPKPTHFYGSVKIEHTKLGSTAGLINTEVLQHFKQLPGVSVAVSLDIQVTIPDGMPDDIVRTVRENCRTLNFDTGSFE
ncbi:MAG: DUF499 domain-containing protein [Spirochaetaceae bacterium]|jgi:hypothetical protein|nr:DUF499 domain-containing protein [Spirochaetaceae bacterium]